MFTVPRRDAPTLARALRHAAWEPVAAGQGPVGLCKTAAISAKRRAAARRCAKSAARLRSHLKTDRAHNLPMSER